MKLKTYCIFFSFLKRNLLFYKLLFFFCKGPECTTPLMTTTGMAVSTSSEVTSLSPVEMTPSYRLPTSLLPVHYTVILRPDLYSKVPANFSTPGYVRILINCTEETNNITLHINKITYDNSTIKVFNTNGNPVTINMVTENKELQFLIVHVTSNLMAGNMYTFEMNFTAGLVDDLAGLYYSTFDRNGTTM